ncbi:undecaprenyl-phosphate glucose phosphotransferase [Rhabdobacter roseus]|uniref:Putative colanic acid biosynthesis UDP-glucose lipid carrier transferase n=1 Tax=Rhabdobacter roseus TaxID=1655419 RepID=A0A840TMT0_9BACT|nr:sugar transferase [Rhabdobacter roseus]MBB5284245.1 putative colanic acid biosynthesis UDP-glucose lipid carrier transferase [Rhabdobacter roseus]
MRYRYSELFLPFQLLVDSLLLNIAFFLAYLIRFRTPEVPAHEYVTLALVFNLVWLFLLLILKPYRYSRVTFNADNLLTKLTEITFLHASIIALFWVMVQGYYYSRGQLLMAYCFFYLLGIIWRFGALVFLKLYRARGYNTRKFIVVGYGDLSQSVTAFYENHPELGYEFCGYFGEREGNSLAVGTRGSYEQLESFIQQNHIDFVYCCQPYIENKRLKSIIELSERNHVQVKLVMDFRGFLTNKASIEYHDYLPVIQLSTKPFSNVQQEVAKRIFDVTFSSLTLLIGFPIFLFIAFLVKVTSSGPVLFVQERSGRWGKPFRIYKFRSMYNNADKLAQQHSQGDDDPRITPIGRFLRKTRLDEIPQFYNVIRGDMSIVGPRPLVRYDVDMLMLAAPNDFRKILTVRPGITSIGQIEVGYADNPTTSVKRLQYDLAYLENPSLQTDLWLIAQTVRVMVQGKGR